MSVEASAKKPTGVKKRPATSGRQMIAAEAVIYPQGFVPGPTNRRAAKPLDSGARIEEYGRQLISDDGIAIWRLPGIAVRRISNKGQRPDFGCHIPALSRYTDTQRPQVDGRPEYNVIGSMKGQHTTGSADHKISAEIMDMALAADHTGAIPFVLIDSRIATAGQMADWKRLGAAHLVLVLTPDEVREGIFMPEMTALARRRSALRKRRRANGTLRPRKGGYRYTAAERCYLERRERHAAARAADTQAHLELLAAATS